MIERVVADVVEYLANALWQLPLLALGAWWLLRATRLGPLAQHRVWLAVLGLSVVLPLARVAPQAVVVGTADRGSEVLVGGGGPGGGFAVANVSTLEVERAPSLSWVHEAVRRRNVEVSAGVARGLAGVYFALMMLGGLRLLRAWGAARRLVAEAENVPVSECLQLLLEQCAGRIGVAVPRVLKSREVLSPAAVGSVLMVPEGFAQYSEDETRAALLHEMAHLQRRDYQSNLLCEAARLPIVWHPVSYAVRRRIRSTREMVCDEVAAGAMGSAHAYALMLVGLAAKARVGDLEAQSMAVGLFTNNNLEERVMRLIETKQTLDRRARVVRLMSATAGMVAVVALVAMVHVTPAWAQETTSTPTQSAVPAVPTPPAIPVAPAPAAPPAVSTLPDPPAVPALPAPPAPGVAPNVPAAPDIPPIPAPALRTFTESSVEAKSADEPLAMAHGVKSTIEPQEGTFLHEWKGADGQPFKIANREQTEPTVAQKKHYEDVFKREMVDMNRELAQMKIDEPQRKREIAEARRQVAKVRAQMDSPEFQRQMSELNSPAFQKQMADVMANAKLEMDASKEERLAAMKQMKELNSEEMQKGMADLRKQLADARLNGINARLQMKQLDSAEMKQQMADMDRQVKQLTNKNVQQEISEQMKAARKQIEDAQSVLEKEHLKMEAAPVTPCSGDCQSAPQ